MSDQTPVLAGIAAGILAAAVIVCFKLWQRRRDRPPAPVLIAPPSRAGRGAGIVLGIGCILFGGAGILASLCGLLACLAGESQFDRKLWAVIFTLILGASVALILKAPGHLFPK